MNWLQKSGRFLIFFSFQAIWTREGRLLHHIKWINYPEHLFHEWSQTHPKVTTNSFIFVLIFFCNPEESVTCGPVLNWLIAVANSVNCLDSSPLPARLSDKNNQKNFVSLKRPFFVYLSWSNCLYWYAKVRDHQPVPPSSAFNESCLFFGPHSECYLRSILSMSQIGQSADYKVLGWFCTFYRICCQSSSKPVFVVQLTPQELSSQSCSSGFSWDSTLYHPSHGSKVALCFWYSQMTSLYKSMHHCKDTAEYVNSSSVSWYGKWIIRTKNKETIMRCNSRKCRAP